MQEPETMRECPVCQEAMEEITLFVTECCGAEMEEGAIRCPFCDAENPLIVKRDPTFRCESCGFSET